MSHYFRHPAFLPSFSLALLHLTVLSFSGQMITFLISVGYTSLHVGLARTLSTGLEISATWAAPRVMDRVGAVRGGLWSICWLMCWLAAGAAWFFADSYSSNGSAIAAATALAMCVAVSRLGLWGFDLCAQLLVQDVSSAAAQFPTLHMSDSNPVIRKWRPTIEVRSLPSRQHSRTSSSSFPSRRPSFFPSPDSFNGPLSLV